MSTSSHHHRVLRDENATTTALMKAVRGRRAELPSLPVAEVCVVSNVTLNALVLQLQRHALLAGAWTEVHLGSYDDPIGDVVRWGDVSADRTILFPVLDNLLPALENRLAAMEPDEASDLVVKALEPFLLAASTVAPGRLVTCGLHPIALPGVEPVEAAVNAGNEALRSATSAVGGSFVDLRGALASVGLDAAVDWRFYGSAKAPYAPRGLDAIARSITAATRAFGCVYPKLLVLDCDQTLWGGIVGEDGIDGVELDPFKAPGCHYWRAQHTFAALERRGMLLALCSRNEEHDVDRAFSHPSMVLRPEHIVTRRINWDDKADNISSIADELGIGLSAVMFVDDSPRECERVRTALPDVRVYEVPGQPSLYPALLRRIIADASGDGVSKASRAKTSQYRARAELERSRLHASDQLTFLTSLDLRVSITADATDDVARVAELTMKTNQFNVTSRRRTAAEVAALVEDPDAVVFGGRVTDRFGDSGLTAVAIVTGLASARAEIDTLLLSCRVLGRGVEDGFWGAILNDLRRRGVREIAAQFRPSAKNAQVEGLWKRLGFVLERADESAHEYRANVASLDAPAAPWIEVTFQ